MTDLKAIPEFKRHRRFGANWAAWAGALTTAFTASEASAQARGDFGWLDFTFRLPAGSRLLTLFLLIAALAIGAYALYRIVLHRSVVGGIHPSAVRNGLVLLASGLFVLGIRYWTIVPMGNGWVALTTLTVTALSMLLLAVRKVAPPLGGAALIAMLVTALAEFTGMLR